MLYTTAVSCFFYFLGLYRYYPSSIVAVQQLYNQTMLYTIAASCYLYSGSWYRCYLFLVAAVLLLYTCSVLQSLAVSGHSCNCPQGSDRLRFVLALAVLYYRALSVLQAIAEYNLYSPLSLG
jgi:hypothetical protein